MFDVIVVGGGPAGLSAALMLGRCRRRVLVCDERRPRNRHSRALHGFLSRDGIVPEDLNHIGRLELQRYGVECRTVTVNDVTRREGAFDITLADGGRERARPKGRSRLGRNGVEYVADTIAHVVHEDGQVTRLEFLRRPPLMVQAIFFTTAQHPRCGLAATLGCRFNRKGTVDASLLSETNVPGVFVAGDASHDAQFVIVAAAEGAKAALAINQALQRAELRP